MRIDAREIPENERKQRIIKDLKALKDGESLVIVNSHDMSPLIKLLEREAPGQFLFEYIKKGPGEWELNIARKSIDSYTVEELLNINPSSIFVLHKYGIDFYLNYNSKIVNLFLNKREKANQVFYEALGYKAEVFKFIRPWLWPPALIMDYIVNNHHRFIYHRLPEIDKMIKHLEKNYGAEFPNLQRLNERFSQFILEMKDHLNEEEKIIFPAIRKTLNSRMGKDKKMLFLLDELNWMKEDHFLTGDNIKSVRQICNNYISDKDDLPGLTLVFQELQDLENDFLIHILFEDHFLSKSIEQLL